MTDDELDWLEGWARHSDGGLGEDHLKVMVGELIRELATMRRLLEEAISPLRRVALTPTCGVADAKVLGLLGEIDRVLLGEERE